MQTLQCLSRALALATARVLPGVRGAEEAALGGAAAEGGAQELRDRVIFTLHLMLDSSLRLVTALLPFGAVAAPPPQQQAPAAAAPADKERRRLEVSQRVFAAELASALADSGVMEHTARAVLVAAKVACEPDSRPNKLASACNNDHGLIRWAARRLADAAPSLGGAGAAARLRAALQHPCVLHLELTSGLAALCLADGGPSYGLPHPLLQGLPVLTRGADGTLGTVVAGSVGAGALHGRQCVAGATIIDFVNCLPVLLRQPLDPPALRPAAAAPLLLRVGRWAVASGRAWAEAEPPPAAGEEAHGAVPPPPPLQLLLECNKVPDALVFVIDTLDTLLTDVGPAVTHGWAWRAAVGRWELVAEACRHVLPSATHAQVEALARLWSPITEDEESGLSGALPPEPPAQVAAALAAGLLPCLERLLRRGGEHPSGNEAQLAAKLLETNALSHLLLARLLAYGEPAQAAALVTTIAKVLSRKDVYTPALLAVSKLCATCHRFTGPEPSAAHPQLRLMLLRSAVEWLPPLSRHAQRASADAKGFCEARAMQRASACANVLSLQLDPLHMWTLILLEGQSHTAAGAGGTPDDGGRTGDGGGTGNGGWRRFVLGELQVLPLLGSLLRDMGAWSFPPSAAQFVEAAGAVWHKTVFTCAAVALALPEEVRQAAAAAKTRAAGGRGPRRGRSGAKRPKDGGSIAAYWPPETLVSLGEKFTEGRVLALALASLLRRWAAGEDDAAEVRAVRWGLSDRDEWLQRWGPLPHLASVRSLLPTCAHPRCTRLDGDSEAGRELRRYPGCGEGAYCSAACAHEHGAGAGGSGAGGSEAGGSGAS